MDDSVEITVECPMHGTEVVQKLELADHDVDDWTANTETCCIRMRDGNLIRQDIDPSKW